MAKDERRYVEFPQKPLYVVRRKGTNLLRTGVEKRSVPKLYWTQIEVDPDEELIELSILLLRRARKK